MTDLTTLIARLEAATAPDRELDAEIMFDMFASPVGQHQADGGPIGYIRLDDQPSWNLGIRFPGKDREWFSATRKQIKGETLVIYRDGAYVLMNSIRVEEFTKSIDAAVALAERVLPGWGGLLGIGSGTSIATADLWSEARGNQSDEDDELNPIVGEDTHAEHASLPIALVIAILRAKQAEGKV